jgi:phosphate transport system protein
METKLDQELEIVRRHVERMLECCDQMLSIAVEDALDEDTSRVQEVFDLDDEVDVLELEAMNSVVVTIMKRQPVSQDLMFLTSTLAIIGEVEKAGDHACNLAKRARKVAGIFPEELRSELRDLAKTVRGMLKKSVHVYLDYSEDNAMQVIAADEEIDATYKSARKQVAAHIEEQPEYTKKLLRCIEVFHALEHVADRAVDIAKHMRRLHSRPSDAPDGV